MMEMLTLSLPFPPSVNAYWRAPSSGRLKGRHMVSAKGRAYQTEACAAVFKQLHQRPLTLMGPVSVIVTLYPPDRRRRDLDNFNKALFDALTRAGIWQDDSQIKRLLLEWGPVIPKGQVTVAVSEFDPEVICVQS